MAKMLNKQRLFLLTIILSVPFFIFYAYIHYINVGYGPGIKVDSYGGQKNILLTDLRKKGVPDVKSIINSIKLATTFKPSLNTSALLVCSLNKSGPINPDLVFNGTFENIEKKYPNVDGGHWKPKNCIPRGNTAILIPFRGREDNLKVWLNHMIRYLQSQNVEFTIYVVEQADSKLFNRAALINAGFVVSQNMTKHECYIFHDVDKLPENSRHLYVCDSKPKLMIALRREEEDKKMKYTKGALYHWYFGGVTAISRDQFKKINGMSNRYWGWGREDDDFAARVRIKGLGGIFNNNHDAKYVIMKHKHDRKENTMKWPAMNVIKNIMDRDGLNSMNSTVKSIEKKKLYTLISIILH